MARRISVGSAKRQPDCCASVTLGRLLRNLPFGPRCLICEGRGMVCRTEER